jgi:hypothetical protein
MSQLLLHFTLGTCLSTASHVRVVVDGWSLEHSPSIGCTRVLAPAYPVKPVIIMCQTLSLTVDFAIVVVVVVVVVVWVLLVHDALPECGNSQCEYGEPCGGHSNSSCLPSACMRDCAVSRSSCPMGLNASGAATVCSGSGSCLPASGTCACFKGYVGDACQKCATNFVRTRQSG